MSNSKFSATTATSTTATTDTPAKGDGHSGVFSSKYRKNPQVAAAVIDAIDAWRKAPEFDNFDDDLCNSLWSCLCDVSMEEMKKLIKASVKRETKKKAKFEVDEKVLPKPPRSASDIFNKELTAKAKATGTKVPLKERQEQWSKLSDSEKDKYIKKCEDAKAHYKAEYAKLRQQAIDAGDIPSDAPKKALTTYFLFRAHMLNELKPKYLLTPKEEQLPEEQKKKLKREKHVALNEEITTRWEKAKSSNEPLYVKFEEQSRKLTDEHRVKLAEWKKTEQERQSRKNGTEVQADEPHVDVVSHSAPAPAPTPTPAPAPAPAPEPVPEPVTTDTQKTETTPKKTVARKAPVAKN